MPSKIKSHEDYQSMKGDCDVILLVAAINGKNLKFDGHKYLLHALHKAKKDFYGYY